MVNFTTLLLFFIAWLLAQVVLDLSRAMLARKNQQRMIAEAYYKITTLITSSLKDLKKNL